MTASVTIGTAGGLVRAAVSAWGAVHPQDGTVPLDWVVAADDRWHVPRVESTVRQHRVSGTPVVATAVRVPGGDIVQRAYVVAEAGGLIVIELENQSRLPVAIGLTRADVRAARLATPPPGAPDGVLAVMPLAHGATVRVVIGSGPPPDRLPSAEQVARGWVTHVDRGVRVVVPDDALTERLIMTRCDALLADADPSDPIALTLTAAEQCRLGERASAWVVPVADAAVAVAKEARRGPAWDHAVALEAAADVLRRSGDARAAGDVEAMRARLGAVGSDPCTPPDGVRFAAWLVRRLVRPTVAGADLFAGYDDAWRGRGVEAYGAPAGRSTIGAALRWHGARPALLWEASPPVKLACTALDPSWSTAAERGETLLATPVSQ